MATDQHRASSTESSTLDETHSSIASSYDSPGQHGDNGDDKGPRGSSFGSLLRVFQYNDMVGWALNIIACMAMLGAGVAFPLMNVVFGNFIDTFNDFTNGSLSPDGYMEQVNHFALYFVYLFIGKLCLTYVWTVLINITAIRTTRNLRVDFLRQTLRQEISFFDSPSSSVSSQITTNVNLVNNGISEKLGLIIQALSMFVSAFIVAFIVQWKLTLITLAIVPFNAVITLGCIYLDAKYEYKMFNIYAESGSLAEEAFSTIRTAHAFSAFAQLTMRFDGILERARRLGKKKSLIYAILFPTEFFSIVAGYALAFWQGMRMYSTGEIQSPGTVVTVIFAVLVASQALTMIAPQTVAISKAMAAARDMFSTIDRKSAIDSLAEEGTKITGFKGDIKLRGVHFSYPSRPSVPILHGLDLDIPSNRTTALVGASGSGKSTIFGLLERWYAYSGGSITLDGHKIENVNLSWLRSNLRLVQQEPTLFSGTIFQNVVDGLTGTEQDGLPDEQKAFLVTEACKAAFAHDFIQELQNGYQTRIGERGASLSGGQKQRIVIARSIISNPKVLLLDEATSALDPNAEKVVQAALNNVAKGRTMVVIAHRLSTIRNADNIVVMAKGETVETGTHSELISMGGAYSRLVKAQDLGKKSGVIEEDPGEEKDEVFADLNKTLTHASNSGTAAEEFTSGGVKKYGLAVMKHYRGEIFDNTLRQDMSFFDKPENATGALVARLASEPTSLQELLSINIALIAVAIINLVCSCILAIAYGWKLGLVLTLGALPFVVGSGYIRIRLESRFEEDTVERFAKSSAMAAEAVMGIRTVASLALEKAVIDRYSEKLRGITRHSIRSLGFKMFFYSISQSTSLLAMGLGFWYGSKLVSTGEYSSGQFYIVFLAVIFSGEAAATFFQYSTSITKAGTAMNYIFRLRRDRISLDGEEDDGGNDNARNAGLAIVSDTEPPQGEKASGKGSEIAFDKVCFSYPLRPKQTILRGVDMAIQASKMVAFVGASGCGKSTMISLLERFYDPTSGQLRSNGRDVRTIDRRKYRRDIALVQQEPVLYQGSIRDNVSLGIESGNPSEAQIIEACQSANVWDFVSSLPEGLDTPCGNQGLSLSGGQRQRIAIARALIRKPRLLLLDEATSALDTESEKVVKEALDRAAAGRTTIAVAHRLSTIRDADTIVVFARGTIVEAGTHDELLTRKGLYYEMVLGQSLDREA
ncbi:hypothetical protein UVI_02044640 [Ustilaginoidea virens]|uniref:Multidrug resistance protein 1 n=1 Tax=Ustilaginoidea virens TaxID=1159556 RepID=A0A1B5L1K3_USTVR|nr:hypothetical protein UVI_02044640 [Ustilaginoidea virens]